MIWLAVCSKLSVIVPKSVSGLVPKSVSGLYRMLVSKTRSLARGLGVCSFKI
jgi:hypothetical protein